MDTVQKVFDDYKILNRGLGYIKTINHIDDDIFNDFKPWTILMSACINGHIKIVERCIRFGADPNKVSYHNSPPLYLALQPSLYYRCELNIAKILFEAGADPNVKIKRDNINIPIIFYLNNVNGINELIKFGALLNEFYKYKELLESRPLRYFIKILAKRRWVTVKCLVITLSLHKRAVITANHPDRLLEQGVFQEF